MKSDKIKYAFRPYDTEFPIIFEKEKKALQKSMPHIPIEHVGSTSVPGLGGKGIIDIAMRIPISKSDVCINKLKKEGYKQDLDHPKNKNSAFLKKILKKKRIHIQLCFNNKYFNSYILFRNYLISHQKERDAYAKIKEQGAKHAQGEKEKYRAYKKALLEKIMKQALAKHKKEKST
ncbi:GrpB family protein [Candidatus Pacearchaeota archaeon]|nr:GrpB family protein [Candidatus Pacearchaeota archaeon]